MLQWLQLPIWLMQLHLSPAACIVYALIANRHRLSINTNTQTGKWSDSHGIYCIYPRSELAAAAGLSITTISRAVAELVAAGLIIDRRLGQGLPNRLYILEYAAAAAVPDPVPDIQRADQLSIDDLMSNNPDAVAEATAAAQAAPEVLQEQAALAAPALEEQAALAAPALEEQAAPEVLQEQAALAAPALEEDSGIERTSIPESKELRFPYNKKKIKKIYSDRSSGHKSDNLSAVRRCLQSAYGIDPNTISHDQYTTATERTSRALDVRNPVTYTAAIISQLVSTASIQPSTDTPLTEFDREWIASVMAYEAARAVV